MNALQINWKACNGRTRGQIMQTLSENKSAVDLDLDAAAPRVRKLDGRGRQEGRKEGRTSSVRAALDLHESSASIRRTEWKGAVVKFLTLYLRGHCCECRFAPGGKMCLATEGFNCVCLQPKWLTSIQRLALLAGPYVCTCRPIPFRSPRLDFHFSPAP